MNKIKVITIDGPSSSGKGTIAKIIAKRLNFNYLDSGAIYRSLALLTNNRHIASDNLEQILAAINTMDLSFIDNKVILSGEDVTNLIRSEETGMSASILSKIPEVRQNLLDYQRNFADKGGLVTDGRDMGSVVFPNAVLKVFLTASSEVRAKRRFEQLQKLGKCAKMEGILQDILTRDQQDSGRMIAPLRCEADYRLLDNTSIAVDDCVEQILQWYLETEPQPD